jgi:hypothetical protein
MKTGDAVWIEYEGRGVRGRILLASPNGESLMLGFDVILGGHVGMMPILQRADGGYLSLIEGKPVKIFPIPAETRI